MCRVGVERAPSFQVALGRSFVSEYRSQRSKGLDADAVFRETTEPSLEVSSRSVTLHNTMTCRRHQLRSN